MFRPLGHPQVTKMYNEEKMYSIRTLVIVHILSFRDLVLWLSILKLIIYSRSKVDKEWSIYACCK